MKNGGEGLNFETADKAATRLGVTVRAIQKWAKEGKIPYSHKIGRDWMIPADAKKPQSKQLLENKVLSQNSFPFLRFYVGGDFESYLATLSTEEEKAMAKMEYYYLSAEFEKCIIEAKPYLDSPKIDVKITATLYYALSSLCRGTMDKNVYSAEKMGDILKNGILNQEDEGLVAVTSLASFVASFRLSLTVDNLPQIKTQIISLKEGARAFGCYLMAYEEYLQKRYEKALGIAEVALCLCDEEYVVAKIYLHIISAMCCINLMEVEESKIHIEKAGKLACPQIIMPFAEHYNHLGGLVENVFKLNKPDYYNKIIRFSKLYNSFCYDGFSKSKGGRGDERLTNVELTISTLYVKGWRVKEIATHLHLSERTVTNYISYIYDKLNINSRKQLEKIMSK